MNAQWFGDSYDVVKRFFIDCVRRLGYKVFVDPMPTGDWVDVEDRFFAFLGASHVRDFTDGKSALLLDPDTGIGERSSSKHTTIPSIVEHLGNHELVLVFDQSFSRGLPMQPQLAAKLDNLAAHGGHGFFYDSHARFLFASRAPAVLDAVKAELVNVGLPETRFIQRLPKGRVTARN